jgi:hypothetical protein
MVENGKMYLVVSEEDKHTSSVAAGSSRDARKLLSSEVTLGAWEGIDQGSRTREEDTQPDRERREPVHRGRTAAIQLRLAGCIDEASHNHCMSSVPGDCEVASMIAHVGRTYLRCRKDLGNDIVALLEAMHHVQNCMNVDDGTLCLHDICSLRYLEMVDAGKSDAGH